MENQFNPIIHEHTTDTLAHTRDILTLRRGTTSLRIFARMGFCSMMATINLWLYLEIAHLKSRKRSR
jgi:hypothetical protein